MLAVVLIDCVVVWTAVIVQDNELLKKLPHVHRGWSLHLMPWHGFSSQFALPPMQFP